MAGGWELELARRYLGAGRRSRFSSLVGLFSLAGVFIGTAALVVATSLMNGFEEQVRARLIGRDAHLDLLPADPSGFPDGDSLVEAVRKADPRVTGAMSFLSGKAGISSAAAADGIVVMGVDAARVHGVIDLQDYVTAGSFDLRDFPLDSGRLEHGIVLGDWLAQRLGVIPGEKVTLLSLSASDAYSGQAAPRYLRARVTGLFHSGMYEYDANLAYVGVPAAQKLYSMPGRVSGIQVRVSDLWQAREVGDALAARLGGGVRALDWFQKNENLMKWMRLEKVVVVLVLCLIILVAAFNISSSLVMAVLERTREIGILRTMGAPAGAVMRVFVWQGALAGLWGTLGGTAFGLALCWVQHRFHVITLPGDVYFIEWLPVSVHPFDVALTVVAALALCLLAALFPAWRASRLSPVEAIRHD